MDDHNPSDYPELSSSVSRPVRASDPGASAQFPRIPNPGEDSRSRGGARMTSCRQGLTVSAFNWDDVGPISFRAAQSASEVCPTDPFSPLVGYTRISRAQLSDTGRAASLIVANNVRRASAFSTRPLDGLNGSHGNGGPAAWSDGSTLRSIRFGLCGDCGARGSVTGSLATGALGFRSAAKPFRFPGSAAQVVGLTLDQICSRFARAHATRLPSGG